MSTSPPAARRFELRDPKHNWVMQITDFSTICISVVIIVSCYPPAASSAALLSSIAAMAGVLFWLAGSATSLYLTPWLRHRVIDEVRAVGVCWAWAVAPLMMLGFATKVLVHFSRVATIGWILVAPALIVLYRVLVRASARARGTHRRAAIVGVTEFGEHICAEIRNAPALGMRVVGLFDDRATARSDSFGVSAQSVGSFAQLVAAARDRTIDVIYIALPLRAEHRVRELILRLQDTTASVYVAFDFRSFADGAYRQISYVGHLPVVPLQPGAQRSVKEHALTLVRAVRLRLPNRPVRRRPSATRAAGTAVQRDPCGESLWRLANKNRRETASAQRARALPAATEVAQDSPSTQLRHS